MSAFDVRMGNGRFKNNLMAEKHQPPNLLINIIVRPPGLPSITAEVQIYLCGIEELIEHRYYEVLVYNSVVLVYSSNDPSRSCIVCFRSFERRPRKDSSMKLVMR